MEQSILISTEHLDYIMIHRDFTTFESIPMCERINDSIKWKYRITDFRRKTRNETQYSTNNNKKK